MKYRKLRGQFMVEFVLSLWIWGALFLGFIFIGKILLLKQHVHQVARYGTLLQSTKRVSDSLVFDQCEGFSNVLSGGKASAWKIRLGRYLETPASRFYYLVQTQVTAPVPRTKWVVSDRVVCQREGGN
ncbi:MAG: hypothetical protein KCHDKBKB_01748 [Elusimicrobia bacterium]|nr:hypothetical protein [Elusimicrobiota bacterium]